MKKFAFPILLLLSIFNSCKEDYSSTKYLEKVLSELEQIQSASYSQIAQGWAPGDTSAYATYYRYFKEYNNDADTAIGASYVSLMQMDTNQLSFCYDGNMRAIVYENDKSIVIDSFKLVKLPFRPVNAPFFNYTKNIIKYALETKDSITLQIEDLKDSVHMKLAIFENKQVEFHGKAFYNKNPFSFDEDISRYEIWIDKSNNLPYKVYREQSHDISSRTISNIKLNKLDIKNFRATDFFSSDYKITPYRIGKRTRKSNFLNKKAPNWILTDSEHNAIALNDLKSKVVLLEFTSVSCGPCRASVPFLKELQKKYSSKELDIIAIEAFNRNSNVLKNYQKRSQFDYKFLMSNEETNGRYQIEAVPVFFILDQDKMVRKVIYGYSRNNTDKTILNAIDELLY